MKIFTFDTTLRDGTQGEAVSFSVDDKLVIAQKLDELGIDYIEGGWPGSNPEGQGVLRARPRAEVEARRLTAFGSTRFAKNPVERGPQRAGAGGGRTRRWSRSSARAGTCTRSRALGITEEENLKLISETVRYLKEHGKEVVYDAEHFFDGYIAQSATSRCGRSKRRSTPAPTCCACATPTAAPSPGGCSEIVRRGARAVSTA